MIINIPKYISEFMWIKVANEPLIGQELAISIAVQDFGNVLKIETTKY